MHLPTLRPLMAEQRWLVKLVQTTQVAEATYFVIPVLLVVIVLFIAPQMLNARPERFVRQFLIRE